MDIRSIIKLLEQTGTSSKIDRSAFLYLDPVTPKEQFAQCGTCLFFLPDKQRCGLFSKDVKVVAEASCGLYIHGTPDDDQKIRDVVSPKEAGYILGSVRCENCIWFNADPQSCGLFEDINKAMPDVFDLDETVDAYGCCNGWQPKK